MKCHEQETVHITHCLVTHQWLIYVYRREPNGKLWMLLYRSINTGKTTYQSTTKETSNQLYLSSCFAYHCIDWWQTENTFINLLLIHLKSHADNIHNRKLSNVEYSLILFHKVWEGKKRNQWLEGNLVQIVLKPGQKDGLNQRKRKIYVYVYVYGITLHLAQKMVKAERQEKKKMDKSRFKLKKKPVLKFSNIKVRKHSYIWHYLKCSWVYLTNFWHL